MRGSVAWSFHINPVRPNYSDIKMGAMASQITSLTIVYSTVYSGADQRKHQSSASLAFGWGIHRWQVNSPHEGPVPRKMFPFDDVTMSHRIHGIKKTSISFYGLNYLVIGMSLGCGWHIRVRLLLNHIYNHGRIKYNVFNTIQTLLLFYKLNVCFKIQFRKRHFRNKFLLILRLIRKAFKL